MSEYVRYLDSDLVETISLPMIPHCQSRHQDRYTKREKKVHQYIMILQFRSPLIEIAATKTSLLI